MIELRQSTAGQEIPLGYFLDSIDGDSPETALTIANTDIKLWKFGATSLANKNSGGATHMADGVYYCTLDATDTNTLGALRVFVHVSGALTVIVDCAVLPANVWDSKYSTDKLEVDVAQWNGTNVATPHTAGYPVVTVKDGTGTGEIATTAGAVDTVTNVTNLHASAATLANQTTILGRIGAFTGSGVNTILGFFQAVMRNDSTTPSDVGGTYDDATDSLQAIRNYTADNSTVATAANQTAILGTVSTINTNVNTLLGRITSTLFSGITSLANWLRVMARSDGADATALTELNGGVGDYDDTADSLEAIRDRGDAAWVTGGGGGTDWTSGEREQIRYRLQIDGTQTAPAADAPAQLPVDTQAVDGSTAVAASLADMLDGTGGVTITLAQLRVDAANANGGIYVTNSLGDGIAAVSSGGNGDGISATGNGSGSGLYAVGGATGSGVYALGGSSTGSGLRVQAQAVGSGIYAVGGATSGAGMLVQANALGSGSGAEFYGYGNFPGILANGGDGFSANTHGILAIGGSSLGDGIRAQSVAAGYGIYATGPIGIGAVASGNGQGILATGSGSGAGLRVVGGATGHGLQALGGSTSGDGIHAEAQANGDGIEATGAGAGVDFNADVTVTAMAATALADFFTVDSTETYASAVAGSVVKEIADNASGGGGGTDWTSGEREQIRYRLQIDGTQTAPAADAPAQLPVDTQAVDGSTAVAASLADMLDGTGGVTITLAQLRVDAANANGGIYVTNSLGDGIAAVSSGGNGDGISATGNGSGAGLRVVGGATGHGLQALGGSTSGDGIHAEAQANGDGIEATGAGAGVDFNADVTVTAMAATALADFFTVDSSETYASAVAGSVVKEIADNASGGGGGTDWTSGEREQIRYRLQIDGTQTAPAADAPAQLHVTTDVLDAAAVDQILDETIPEPAGVFTWGGSLRSIVGWLGAIATNPMTETAALATLRNRADSADVATSSRSDTGVTFLRGVWS